LAIPVLGWGLVKFYLDLHDERPELHDLFAGFSHYGKALGRMLLLTVIYVVMALLSEGLVFVGQAMQSTPVIVLGWVVYMVSFALVICRFYFAFFFMVDREMTVMEAMGAAWEATQGKALKTWALALVSGLVAFSGVLGLFIGILFTIPMSYAMYASAYRQLSPR
jgi:hypothetical protein